ncbi:virB8 family protein [Phenylobacterium sp.]|jgi:type IV secretion system protein VirB8|uniref:virB8 family protein n=1 Tax=Phenylobacterium sp. TaxID=1871053 RepID=UPI002F418208
MTGVVATDLKAYFADARRWDEERLQSALRSRRLAWTVAAGAGALAIAAVVAVAALTPLKRVEPFVVRVDNATGAVDVMTALTGPEQLTADEAVTKYFLSQYVRARETWLPSAAEANFRQVSIMSTPAEQERWAAFFRPADPASPQVALGPANAAEVEIRAISFVNRQVASVRFRKTVRQGQQTTTGDWIATLTFAYAQAPMAEADRLRNPLGFQVASYRADPEVVQ